MPPEKPRRLGRGLEALLSVAAPQASPASKADAAEPASALKQIPIAQIRPNPFQPRKEFRPEELAELEASIKGSGLLQPVTVRTTPGGAGYELIAGERRLRAVTRLGWTEVPAVVKEVDDRTILTLALIENLQRADLSALEEAEGYQQLITEFGLTHQQVGELVGKDRTTITSTLRILGLPPAVRRMLQEGHITLGHARALLAVGEDRAIADLAREVVARGLSVREVEERARTGKAQKQKGAGKAPQKRQDPEVKRIEDQIRRYLQTDVSLTMTGRDRGEIRIAFYSNDDLERVMELLLGATGDAL